MAEVSLEQEVCLGVGTVHGVGGDREGEIGGKAGIHGVLVVTDWELSIL